MIEVRRQVTAAACLIFGVTDLFFLNSVVFPRVLRRTSTPDPLAPLALSAPAPPAAAPALAVAAAPRVEPMAPVAPGSPRRALVFFASAVRRLDDVSRATIDRVVAELDQNANATLLVEGHSDVIGEADFNVRLSRRRAVSVLEYLKQRGLPASRVVVRGYGCARPVATGHDPESLQRNRRVEITVRGGS